jgi:hypothetical protein
MIKKGYNGRDRAGGELLYRRVHSELRRIIDETYENETSGFDVDAHFGGVVSDRLWET